MGKVTHIPVFPFCVYTTRLASERAVTMSLLANCSPILTSFANTHFIPQMSLKKKKIKINLTESNLIERSVGWQSTHMAIFPTTHTLEKILVYPISASVIH